MMKIVEYKAVWGYKLDSFNKKVNKMIGEGWTLYGQLQTVPRKYEIEYVQTLVRLEEVEEDECHQNNS